jgi:8-oxo-dGTP diphosphatase
VAAVIRGPGGACLIARRPEHADQGGLWEFPGGKVEPGETAREALGRELMEELGIVLLQAAPLIQIPHHYPHRAVWLDVWEVTRFSGRPHGREGQPLRWVSPPRLREHVFPAANRPIVHALNLPDRLLVTPEPGRDFRPWLARLDRALARGIRLVQFRAHGLDEGAYRDMAREVLARCRGAGARCVLNASPALVETLGADGVHLNRHALRAWGRRPLPRNRWVSASVHDAHELRLAMRAGVDFALVSPVRSTPSHPEAPALGWPGLETLARQAPFPVYALGGVGPDDLGRVRAAGAQGVAAIRAFWDGGD